MGEVATGRPGQGRAGVGLSGSWNLAGLGLGREAGRPLNAAFPLHGVRARWAAVSLPVWLLETTPRPGAPGTKTWSRALVVPLSMVELSSRCGSTPLSHAW